MGRLLWAVSEESCAARPVGSLREKVKIPHLEAFFKDPSKSVGASFSFDALIIAALGDHYAARE